MIFDSGKLYRLDLGILIELNTFSARILVTKYNIFFNL